jgi:hypothetical protein
MTRPATFSETVERSQFHWPSRRQRVSENRPDPSVLVQIGSGEWVKVERLTNWWAVMSTRKGLEGLFDGRHFDREIIVLCVRWYLRSKLSLRDLVEMMAER